MTPVPATDASASQDGFGQPLTSIITTAKWIVSAAAAVLAVLIAGLQVSQVGGLALHQMLVALGAYIVAVAGAGRVLLRAARVLITPGFTVSDLADKEMRARVKAVEAARGDLSQIRPAHEFDPLLSALARRRRELLPGEPADLDLQSFYSRHTALAAAWATASSGHPATVDGTTYQPDNDTQLAVLRSKLDQSSSTAETLVDAAHLYAAKGEYRRLVRSLTRAGAAVVIAVPVFALASHKNLDQVGARVSMPTTTHVLLKGSPSGLRHAGVPANCKSKELTGTAVGGTYAQPLVVVSAPSDCRGARLLVNDQVGVALPNVASRAPAAATS